MKKGKRILAGICLVLLFCLPCAGCGQEAEDYAAGSASLEYYDISSKKEELFEGRKEEGGNGSLLGMQYYRGEPVQIWLSFEDEKGNVYLCRPDGSRELLQEDVQAADIVGERWYADEDGSFYCWKRSWGVNIEGEDIAHIRKLDGAGKELFYRELQQGILLWDLCKMGNGSILLLIQDGQGGDMKVAELNPANGSLSDKPGVKLGQSVFSKYIAGGEQGVLVLDTGNPEGISEISMADGSVFSALSFAGTSYSMENSSEGMDVRDFRMLEDGTVEILWADIISGRGIQESLRLSKMEKTPVILQTTYVMADAEWLQKRIGEFNRDNSSYQVILERPDLTSPENYGEKVAVQMATGKGPDILYGYALMWVYGLVEKGGFEDLAPYMEQSGIREEDYFPYAFSCLRDGEKVYTFRMKGTPGFGCIKEKYLGGREVLGIEALLDALLDLEEDVCMVDGDLSRDVLEMFLDSKDIWGMIDWEKGTCDFSGELFAKILKVAKRYGLSWEKAIAGDFEFRREISEFIDCSLVGYKTSAELKKMGLANRNELLGKEYCASVGDITYAIAVNANSVQKEGAWEFIRYIMSEEVQMMVLDYNERTNKQAHMAGVEQELKKLDSEEGAKIGGDKRCTRVLSNGESVEEYNAEYTKEDMTQERIDEYLNVLENAGENITMDYMRILPVYEIIEEEAEYYFGDVKSLEEVVDTINSRVGMYVGEQH